MAKDKVYKLLATGIGLGNLPKAPGTWGSLGALLFSLIILNFASDPFPNFFHLILSVTSYFVGVHVCKKLIPIWGEDPGRIVIDEMCGLWIAFIFCPSSVYYYVLGFILFRFFDITKVLGISKVDSIKGAHSIMLDDVLAGVYSGIILYFIYFFDILHI